MTNLLFAVAMSTLAGTFIAFDAPDEYRLGMAVSLILVAQFAIKQKVEDLERTVKKWKEETSDSDSKK